MHSANEFTALLIWAAKFRMVSLKFDHNDVSLFSMAHGIPVCLSIVCQQRFESAIWQRLEIGMWLVDYLIAETYRL